MQNLENELKALIVTSLQLEGVSADDIESDSMLFGDGLGLDSLDALELGAAIQKRFNIKLDASNSANKMHFRSVRHLATFIQSQQQ